MGLDIHFFDVVIEEDRPGPVRTRSLDSAALSLAPMKTATTRRTRSGSVLQNANTNDVTVGQGGAVTQWASRNILAPPPVVGRPSAPVGRKGVLAHRRGNTVGGDGDDEYSEDEVRSCSPDPCFLPVS